jgi:glutamate dehydrogenase
VGEGERESLMHLEIDRQSQAAMATIKARLAQVLEDVRAIVADWQPMREKMRAVADELGHAPHAGGRRQARGAGIPALGRQRPLHLPRLPRIQGGKQGKDEVLVADEDSGLGLLRGKDSGAPRLLKSLAAHGMPQSGAVDALILTKTNARATVHRPGYMDYIGVLELRRQGPPIASSVSSACTPPAPTTAARGRSRWCASATNT